MDARKLSNSEKLRLWGLLRIHSMASLVLYKQRCGYPSSTELLLIEDQFDRLPEDYRLKALEHEIKAIESVLTVMGGKITNTKYTSLVVGNGFVGWCTTLSPSITMTTCSKPLWK